MEAREMNERGGEKEKQRFLEFPFYPWNQKMNSTIYDLCSNGLLERLSSSSIQPLLLKSLSPFFLFFI
jgi:hypothetical protein